MENFIPSDDCLLEREGGHFPGDDFDCEAILDKYGPEGAYYIGSKLIDLAHKDVDEAISQAFSKDFGDKTSTYI